MKPNITKHCSIQRQSKVFDILNFVSCHCYCPLCEHALLSGMSNQNVLQLWNQIKKNLPHHVEAIKQKQQTRSILGIVYIILLPWYLISVCSCKATKAPESKSVNWVNLFIASPHPLPLLLLLPLPPSSPPSSPLPPKYSSAQPRKVKLRPNIIRIKLNLTQ